MAANQQHRAIRRANSHAAPAARRRHSGPGGAAVTPERWQRVKEVLEWAWERDAAERDAFLDQVCAGDPELRSQVDALLISDEHGGDFLAAPVAELAAASFTDPTSSLASVEFWRAVVSAHLGILREIGHGGMGTVYLASRFRWSISQASCNLARQALPRYRRNPAPLPQRTTGRGRSRPPKYRPASRWWRDRGRPSLSGHGVRGRSSHRCLVRQQQAECAGVLTPL